MARFGDRYRVGLDIGGTFTDFVLLDQETGEIRLHKCLTTPDDPATGALDGLGQLLSAAWLAMADVDALVHGTTLGERQGAHSAKEKKRGCCHEARMGLASLPEDPRRA
jgi:predicted NBD/HSP70 family sugar kinase